MLLLLHPLSRLQEGGLLTGVHCVCWPCAQVSGATFDEGTGLWTVTSSSGAAVKGRVLICADGATSPLATKLGYCTEAPRGVCSRAFVSGGGPTKGNKSDGMTALLDMKHIARKSCCHVWPAGIFHGALLIKDCAA